MPHFTNKAKVDAFVKDAGFENYTFVQPPFYYQNLAEQMRPQAKEDGTKGWTLPIDPTKKVIHMANIHDLGKVVAGAFLNPAKTGKGNYLSLATELNSFNKIIETYKENGREYTFTQVPAEVFSNFFEGAKELAQMLGYFQEYTYMGPDSEGRIKMAEEIATGKLTSLDQWIKQNG